MALVGARRRGLWGDTVVELDSAINHVVRAVRAALGDDASDPSFIETVPRRGYRFAAEVEADPGPDGPDGKPEAACARDAGERHDAPPTPEAAAPPRLGRAEPRAGPAGFSASCSSPSSWPEAGSS